MEFNWMDGPTGGWTGAGLQWSRRGAWVSWVAGCAWPAAVYVYNQTGKLELLKRLL